MKLLVISSAPFIKKDNYYYAYGPYINEMEIWKKFTDNIMFCCPFSENKNSLLLNKIPFKINRLFVLKEFNFLSFIAVIKSPAIIFYNIIILFHAFFKSDCIHIRCPGNIGLLACFVQLFFPLKKKTAKYAGNWDPKSNQPFSYKLQKWILSNSFLTKNMKVLVYGQWKNQSKNIVPFFTASYSESDKEPVLKKNFKKTIDFIFVGTLSEGKRPLYAIQLVENLKKTIQNCTLHIYGDGILSAEILDYVKNNNLSNYVFLYGNQNQEIIKKAYKESHFILLPSISEGWPKVLAEAMFWGCLPVSTSISCVPYMLDYENRGVLITTNLNNDSNKIIEIIHNQEEYQSKIQNAINWSRNYTLDLFQNEIKSILLK